MVERDKWKRLIPFLERAAGVGLVAYSITNLVIRVISDEPLYFILGAVFPIIMGSSHALLLWASKDD